MREIGEYGEQLYLEHEPQVTEPIRFKWLGLIFKVLSVTRILRGEKWMKLLMPPRLRLRFRLRVRVNRELLTC